MIRVFCEKGRSGPENMAIDVSLMKHAERIRQPFFLRLYGWQPPCLSLGRFQSSDIIDKEYLRARGYGLVRRPTGGGAVLHFDELTYSVILAARSLKPGASGARLYMAIGRALKNAINSIGLSAVISGTRSSRREDMCFGSASIGEITVDGRKLVGSAQLRTGNVVLQHGSIVIRSHPADYGSCFLSSRQKTLVGFVQRKMCGIEDILGQDVEVNALKTAVVVSFEKEFRQNSSYLDPGDLDGKFWEDVEIMRRFFSSDEWNSGRVPMDRWDPYRQP